MVFAFLRLGNKSEVVCLEADLWQCISQWANGECFHEPCEAQELRVAAQDMWHVAWNVYCCLKSHGEFESWNIETETETFTAVAVCFFAILFISMLCSWKYCSLPRWGEMKLNRPFPAKKARPESCCWTSLARNESSITHVPGQDDSDSSEFYEFDIL